jgi:hypothetical protein
MNSKGSQPAVFSNEVWTCTVDVFMRHDPVMSAPKPYLCETEAPTRAEVDALVGLTLLEFGTDWCGHCRAWCVQHRPPTSGDGLPLFAALV